MSYCVKCGQELIEGAAFCVRCGAPVETDTPIPAVPAVVSNELDQEACEFLENTHRLLRWEHKAWSIASKVFLIVGIVFAALFMLLSFIGLIAAIAGSHFGGGFAMGMFFIYAVLFGGMTIGFGIVNKKAGEKLPQYIDTVHTDFSLAYNRCGNVGMLVFTVIFGVVSPVFFIINFVRMKANRAVIERIISNQNA
ncbi:MAG: zinc ribbon domain-containing protein [Oscillospiraceae bacterium]|nr:zinc ribbon domain-containing protein [Oscillospiraceae bacterium]